MARNDKRWMNQTGLNLIRIVIGSYFMAVSLGLVTGVDQTALFAPFLPFAFADIIGSTVLFVASIAFMLGVALRQTALVLALFVFCSSLTQNFLIAEFGDISAFWRDLTMVCAIILTYSNMSRRETRCADLIRRRRRMARLRRVRMPGAEVTPRRVTPPGPAKPDAPAAKPAPRIDLPAFMRHPDLRGNGRDTVDINLFANI